MMTTAENAAKPPAGTPAINEASRIAGTKGAKSSSMPKEASIARVVIAMATPINATSKAWGDHGFNRSQYSERSSTVCFPQTSCWRGANTGMVLQRNGWNPSLEQVLGPAVFAAARKKLTLKYPEARCR